MKKIYIVATPIGNLADITLRALDVLKSVDFIVAEDTRHTGILLKKYEINAKLTSFHVKSSESKSREIFAKMRENDSIAYVSDAGTPTISDPGSKLVEEVLKEIYPESPLVDLQIVAVPGASAVTAALSISGIPASEFTFLGFIPHKKGRETLFKEIAAAKRPYVFYESPHRLLKALTSLDTFCPEKNIVITKEITIAAISL